MKEKNKLKSSSYGTDPQNFRSIKYLLTTNSLLKVDFP